jgi:hypothetical protein
VKTLLLGSVLAISYNLQANGDLGRGQPCTTGKAACLPGITPKPQKPDLSSGSIVFDFDKDGCLASSPIVRKDGVYKENPGTAPTGGYSGQCDYGDQLNFADILYKEVCTLDQYCARVFALYTVKDQANPIITKWNHRHDIEHAVIWMRSGIADEVGVSAHGGLDNKIVRLFPRLSSDRNHPDFKKFTVVYHKDGVRTHTLRASKGKDDKGKKAFVNTEVPENPTNKWFEGNIIDVDSDELPTDYKETIAEGDWGKAKLEIKDEDSVRIFLNKNLPGNWKKADVDFTLKP